MSNYRSNGKLLLTGEYVILDGARALAVPTKFGQSLRIKKNNSNIISWKSYDENDAVWFEDKFHVNNGKIEKQFENNNEISNRLIEILIAAQSLNREFLDSNQGCDISTHQDFNRKWGLGTSSTLINNISNWAKVDPYQLLNKTFGGSGYDIACAQNNSALTYQLISENERHVESIVFNPSFKDHLYFVYLNQKQNSRDGIKAYKSLGEIDSEILKKINTITESIITSNTLKSFENLINEHEVIISSLIQQPTVKSRLFKDFNGSIKSLGAWGGDFVLVTSETSPKDYFKSKGYETIIPYKNMVLN